MNTGYLLIPLRRRDGTLRAHAIIDAEDAHLAEHRWHVNGNGYVVRTLPRTPSGAKRQEQLHRVVLGLTPGDGLEGDHENGDTLDCRRANLRIATTALNQQNTVAQAGSTSAHRGVRWDAARGKWEAYAKLNGKQVKLGRFDDEQVAADAASAYRLAHMPFTNEARSVR
jgi:hypothetical protein